MTEPLHASPFDHDAELAKLGLKLEYFYDAIRAGEQARRLTTRNDAPTAAGTDDYHRRLRVLRDGLIDKEKWLRGELYGLPLVVRPDKTLAIGVLLGDHKTGWQGNYHPRSKRPLGEVKIGLIAQNGQQTVMFRRPLVAGDVDLEAEDLSKLATWFFVTYRRVTREGIVVSSELSLPSDVSKSNYVETWRRRIPFPDLHFGNVTPSEDFVAEGYEVAVTEMADS